MNRLLSIILFLLFCDLLFQQCANPRNPTGGPKDSIPPTLTESYPINGTINFNEQEITLKFSEFVNADKLKQQLIITPQTDINYKSIVKRDQLILKFDEPFEDSTTYNLNFADAVVDITEKNPAINLSLAFSTGSYIDSMTVEGTIIDLFDQTPVSGYTVGLYPKTDSLDYFSEKPIYFTTTNDSGKYQLNYLKKGLYRILAFNDDNSNIILDPETEAHGFISEDIMLDSAILFDNPILTILQDVKPISFINSRPTGLYFELKYSKTIDDYSILPDTFQHNLIGETKDAIRIYKPEHLALDDSIQLIVTALDSLNNSTIDTVQAIYFDSNRKPSELSYSLDMKSDVLIDDFPITISFNKPINSIDSTKFYFRKDSTFHYPIQPSFSWNKNNTEVLINTRINKDSVISELKKTIPEDTTETQSAPVERRGLDQRPGATTKSTLPSIQFVIDTAAFISVDNDSSLFKTQSITLSQTERFGTIQFTLETLHESFTIQLLGRGDEVAYQNKNEKEFTFPRIKPGNYKIRVLIDDNMDGKWSAGNLMLNEEPESVYLHPEETSVRENWVLEIAISF